MARLPEVRLQVYHISTSMSEIITLNEKRGVLSCDFPLTKEQWTEILNDESIVTPGRLRGLLAFYYMPGHRASCTQCAEKFGGHFNTYNSAVTSLGEAILKKMGSVRILSSEGKEVAWPVAIGVGKPIKGDSGVFEWTLRSELVEALREQIIGVALSSYTAAFRDRWKIEEYKWRALKTFHDYWDIDAPNFAAMLEKALSRTKNLLVSRGTYPRLMITTYANQEPEAVRAMFRSLFDETQDPGMRMEAFKEEADRLAERLSAGKNHYQNTNAISTYLWLRYPEKYYVYKNGEYKGVAKKIGFDEIPRSNGKIAEVFKGFSNYDVLQESISRCRELLAVYNQLLGEYPERYMKPEGLNTLTFDFGFWISRYFVPQISQKSETPVEEAMESREPDVDITPEAIETPETPDGLEAPAALEAEAPARFWWLVASPKYWSFSGLSVGECVEYTVKNEKGNKRRIPVNFEQARQGDLVIGYEANPVKKIVALARVVRESDGETILFQKIEELEAPVPFASFRNLGELAEMEFIKNQNGSFFRLTPEEYGVINNLIRQDNPAPDEENPIKRKDDIEPYGREKFLSEVFMPEEKLVELMQLLRLKKNIILQGAPGVGKTFSARRLAYTMMGEKDDSRIEMVQFHQNYSYEDFIMGYRPTPEGGFELRTGVFYNFCKKAREHPDRPFFFIIDEINRGNLSRIFGELLMLIENSYRNHSIKLAYRNELFSVPHNLYIIGMMNTADRSLAMIDYALRRRFSFHTMGPGFDTEGFRREMAKHDDPRIPRVIQAIMEVNRTIEKDDSLGSGFRIGHSYFCGQPEDQPWIEQVVRYDICPMLNEYWFDSKEKSEIEQRRLLDLLT